MTGGFVFLFVHIVGSSTRRRLDISWPITEFTKLITSSEMYDESCMSLVVQHMKRYVRLCVGHGHGTPWCAEQGACFSSQLPAELTGGQPQKQSAKRKSARVASSSDAVAGAADGTKKPRSQSIGEEGIPVSPSFAAVRDDANVSESETADTPASVVINPPTQFTPLQLQPSSSRPVDITEPARYCARPCSCGQPVHCACFCRPKSPMHSSDGTDLMGIPRRPPSTGQNSPDQIRIRLT